MLKPALTNTENAGSSPTDSGLMLKCRHTRWLHIEVENAGETNTYYKAKEQLHSLSWAKH